MVAVAIGGAAIVGGVSSVVASNKAADAQRDAADQAAQLQKQEYDTTRSDFAPWRQVGVSALGGLARLYGLPAPTVQPDASGGVSGNYGVPSVGSVVVPTTASGSTLPPIQGPGGNGPLPPGYMTDGIPDGRNMLIPIPAGQPGSLLTQATTPTTPTPSSGAPDYGGFTASPGYQYRVDQATRAIQNSAAARGLLKSGATVKAIDQNVQNVASDEFNNYANRLAALAGVGQTATSSTAAAGENYANNAGNAYMQAGNANASGYINGANAINGGIQNLAGAYLYNRGYQSGAPYATPAQLAPDVSSTLANNPGIF